MHTLVLVNNKIKTETEEVLVRYKTYFAKTFLYTGLSAIDALKLHEASLRRQEAFFIIDDRYQTLTDKQWRSIIIQSSLNTPIIFVRKQFLSQTLVYKHKSNSNLRDIFDRPEILTPSGVYILNSEIYKFLDTSIDSSIKKWIDYGKEKRRGARKSSDILVYVLPEESLIANTGRSY